MTAQTELFAENAHPSYKRILWDRGAGRRRVREKESSPSLRRRAGTFPEEFPWLETNENGDAVPGTETDERLTTWLNSEIVDDYESAWRRGARELRASMRRDSL